jgi:hypothetical protein
VGGAPCRPRCTAFILARMSCETLRPLPRLEMVGAFGGRGFLAALMLPRGVEEKVMFAVAPEVETVRARHLWRRRGSKGQRETRERESQRECQSRSRRRGWSPERPWRRMSVAAALVRRGGGVEEGRETRVGIGAGESRSEATGNSAPRSDFWRRSQ